MARGLVAMPAATPTGTSLSLLNKDTLTQNDYDNVSYPFVMLGCNLGAEINPILYTKKEWKTYQFTPFYENVNRDGIILA